MNKIPEYNSPLMDEIYKNISQTTFDSVANRMALALRIHEANKVRNSRIKMSKSSDKL